MKPIHYATALFLAIIDLASKWLVLERIHPGVEIPIVPGLFQLVLARNPGVAFSLFSEGNSSYKVAIFTLINVLGLVLVVFLGKKLPIQWKSGPFFLSLIMGGIIGNAIDRLIHGSVVDFLDVYLGTYHWPTFNLADSCITVGVFSLAIHELFLRKEVLNSILLTIPLLAPGPLQSPEGIAAEIQKYYGSMKSMQISFSQVYETNGIRQEESGILRILKPGRMRWEYVSPEVKLFLVDGKTSYFYVPADKQVSMRKLNQEDIRYTAFGFLIDQSRLETDFRVEASERENPIPERHRVLKLFPKHPMENIDYLLMGIHPARPEISTLVIQELTGARNSFLFSGLETNPPLRESMFELKIPKGVEILSMDALP